MADKEKKGEMEIQKFEYVYIYIYRKGLLRWNKKHSS